MYRDKVYLYDGYDTKLKTNGEALEKCMQLLLPLSTTECSNINCFKTISATVRQALIDLLCAHN